VSDGVGLRVEDISVRYGDVPAVTDASLEVAAGSVLALVGESGSGKTSLALAIARLLPPGGSLVAGSVRVGEIDVASLAGDELRRSRGRLVGYIAQDAMAALNPVMRAGRQIAEVFEFHDGLGRADAGARTLELLGQVGIRDAGRVARCYPHELSGGMRQRVMIAIALALRPQVLVADEPTTALDVTVQADVLALVGELQRLHGVTLVWITHDMGVVAELADDIAVMYGGRIVERGPAGDVFASPAHPYTQALLATIGDGRAPAKTAFSTIPGTPPHGPPPPGCPFHPRCALAFAPCGELVPQRTPVADGHESSCHLERGRP
jgi:oligopeptide/dipeptide ABC transporter ATP-binding protein